METDKTSHIPETVKPKGKKPVWETICLFTHTNTREMFRTFCLVVAHVKLTSVNISCPLI